MPLSVGNLLLGTASQPMMSAIASSYAADKQDTLTFGYDTSNKITSIDGSAIVGEGAGDTSQCFPASASGMLQPSGNYLSATESSNYYPSSNPSGFITGVDLTNYATTAYVDSSVSSKLDATASSQFLTAVPEGYATTSDLSSLISYSALSGSGNTITSISGSAIGGSVPPTAQLVLDGETMSGIVDPVTQNFYIGVKSGVFALDSTLRALSAWATAQGWTGV